MPLSIVTHTVDQGIIQLVHTGEADLATTQPLGEAIGRAVHGDHVAAVLVDLHAVRFLDCTAIGVLVQARRLADQMGVGYQVVDAEGIVRRVLEVAGVLAYLAGDHSG